MIKRAVFFLIIVLSLSYVLAQESTNELRMRYLSIAGPITLNLTRFLGSATESNYVYIAPPYIDITIDQATGIAVIKGIPGWFGSEVIVFKINRTEEETVVQEENITGKLLLKIPDSELKKLFSYDLAGDSFDALSRDIGSELVRNLQTKLEKDKLLVMVNKDVEISASTSKTPEINIDILTGNISVIKIESYFYQTEGYLANVTIFSLYLIVATIALFYLKYLFGKSSRSKREFAISSSKSLIIERLKQIERSKDPEAPKALMLIINEFFMRYFYVSLNSNIFELRNELERRGIKGNLKQDILSLFEKYKFGVHKKDVKIVINELRSLLRKLD